MAKIVKIIIALTTLTLVTGASPFQFFIARELHSTSEIEKSKWINVEITENNDSENIDVKFDIPLNLIHSSASIFFANNKKEILRVNLIDVIEGVFYVTPHKVTKKLAGEKTKEDVNGNLIRVSGRFPKVWLPEQCSKLSAAVGTADGKWYNYYGLQNFGISIPDLMVLEEYKSHNFP